MASTTPASGDSKSEVDFCDWLHTISRAERQKILQLFSPSTLANGTFSTIRLRGTTQNALSTPHSIRDLVRNGECHFSQASLSMDEDQTAPQSPGAYASLVNGDFDISDAELLSFSIAQSAEIFFQRDVPSPRCPPVPAPTPVSIQAQPSPARPAGWVGGFYEQQAQSGHPPLVEGSNHNQRISSTQQQRSASFRGQQPAPSGDISEAELLSFFITESAEIFFEREVPSPRGPVPALAAPSPSHHDTPNDWRTSWASQAIHRQDLWMDITQPAQPCFSISTWEDRQNRRFREIDENDPCSICVLRLGEACKTGRCKVCSTYFHQACLAEWLTTPTGTQNCPTW